MNGGKECRLETEKSVQTVEKGCHTVTSTSQESNGSVVVMSDGLCHELGI